MKKNLWPHGQNVLLLSHEPQKGRILTRTPRGKALVSDKAVFVVSLFYFYTNGKHRLQIGLF